MRDTIALPVAESSQAGEARRAASLLADRAGFDEVGRGKVALVATELATNLARHATRGMLVFSILSSGPARGLEILSIDRGPGMADFRRCLVDGYSSLDSPGNGLGAVARIADEFDAHSAPGEGTVLAARLWAVPPSRGRAGPALDVAAVCLPMAGEAECGDAWAAVEPEPGRTTILLADGLGHGPAAARAADEAVAALRRGVGSSPSDVIHEAHRSMKGTRGAAVAVARVDLGRREVRFAGVGNIAATIIAPGSRHGLVSLSGTVGGDVRKVQEFAQPWPPGALLVMHSDGLATQWRLDRQSPLAARMPGVIAGVLFRDFARDRDDSTALVARDRGANPG